jgi:hypothetical protein
MFIGWMFRNRWLALGFAAFVCWQAVELAGRASNASAAAENVGGALSNSD